MSYTGLAATIADFAIFVIVVVRHLDDEGSIVVLIMELDSLRDCMRDFDTLHLDGLCMMSTWSNVGDSSLDLRLSTAGDLSDGGSSILVDCLEHWEERWNTGCNDGTGVFDSFHDDDFPCTT